MKLLASWPKAKSKTVRLSRPAKKPSEPSGPAVVPLPLPPDLQQKLLALRRRRRMVFFGEGFSILLGVICLLVLGQGLADWWFDLPWLVRLCFLLADFGLIGWIYHHHLLTPLRKTASLSATALTVEKKWPHLNQTLVSAVELAEGRKGATRGSMQLVGIVVQQARDRTTDLDFKTVVSTRTLNRRFWPVGVAVLATGALIFVTWPASGAFLERMILLNVPLPTKTVVIPITRDMTIPIGTDVELQVRVQGVIPSHGRVILTYTDGTPEEYPVSPDPDQPDQFSLPMHNVQKPFKYQFFLNDGRSPQFSVLAEEPPDILNLACEQTYPDYTGLPPEARQPTDLSLLVGSRLKVTATSTKPLASATLVLPGLSKNIPMTLDFSKTGAEAEIPIPAKDLTGFSVHLVDTAGVPSTGETVYPIVLVPDLPPTVKILEPEGEKETITLQAKPQIVIDAGDDYGLTKLELDYQMIPPPVNGEMTTPLPPEKHLPLPIKDPKALQHIVYVLNAAAETPAWQEGWSVNYWVEAVDNNTATGPGVTRTDHKQFGILSPEAKEEEIEERLKQSSGTLLDISDEEHKISNDVGDQIQKK